jgi:hypothetical protein
VQKDAAAAIRCRMKREKIDSLSPGAGQFSASLIIDGFVLRRRPLCPAETISSFANSGRLSGRRPKEGRRRRPRWAPSVENPTPACISIRGNGERDKWRRVPLG